MVGVWVGEWVEGRRGGGEKEEEEEEEGGRGLWACGCWVGVWQLRF